MGECDFGKLRRGNGLAVVLDDYAARQERLGHEKIIQRNGQAGFDLFPVGDDICGTHSVATIAIHPCISQASLNVPRGGVRLFPAVTGVAQTAVSALRSKSHSHTHASRPFPPAPDPYSPRATGRCRGIWALKSPSHGQSVRLFRSTSVTQTVPHSLAWARMLPSWP